jgi:crotonobetaine/carnitine-CoA ligase
VVVEGRAGNDTVWSIAARRAELDADRPLVTFLEEGCPDEVTSWASLVTRAEGLAAHLGADGVGKGATVGLFGLNSVDYIAALLGVARLGAVAVPLNALLAPPEIAWQLGDSGAAAVAADAEATSQIEDAVGAGGWSGPKVSLRGAAPGWEPAWASAPAGALDGAAPPAPEDPFEILYTSGTTGRPKGVVLTHRSVAADAVDIAALWAARADDTFLGVLPLFHVNAQMVTLFPAITVGARLVLCRAFSARGWIDVIRRHGVTIASIVGTQLRMIMATPEQPDDAATSLRCLPYGLNVPLPMWEAFERRFGAPLINIYGLTEAVAIATAAPLGGDRRIPSIGRPARGKAVAILDEAGHEAPRGTPGEICVRGRLGASLMLGYHGLPEETASAVRDGWLHTGDIGTMDGDGYCYFVDRAKDIIKHSGENVSASEVERVLSEHPAVQEAAVVGRPDPIRDETVIAFVILRDGESATTAALADHCRANLARFKIPAEIHLVAGLPRTAVGKVEKRALRSRLAETAALEGTPQPVD